MNNRVFLGEGNIIRSVSSPAQTDEEVATDLNEIARLSRQLRAEGKPVLVLADLTKAKKVSFTMRKASQKFFKLDTDKIAVLGVLPRLAMLSNFLAKLSGYQKLQTFSDEKSAVEYLLG